MGKQMKKWMDLELRNKGNHNNEEYDRTHSTFQFLALDV